MLGPVVRLDWFDDPQRSMGQKQHAVGRTPGGFGTTSVQRLSGFLRSNYWCGMAGRPVRGTEDGCVGIEASKRPERALKDKKRPGLRRRRAECSVMIPKPDARLWKV